MYSVNRHDGYIYGVASGDRLSGEIISREEYERIRAAIMDRPEPVTGYGWRLRDNLEWELYELPPGPEPSGEISDTEALAIILGEVSM